MLATLKDCVRGSFRSLGWEVGRVNPAELNKYVWLRKHGIRTVLDIGAHRGEFATQFHGLFPESRIYSFEPLKDCYEALLARMKGVPAFTAFNFALGDEE